jgi:hypothetical protein
VRRPQFSLINSPNMASWDNNTSIVGCRDQTTGTNLSGYPVNQDLWLTGPTQRAVLKVERDPSNICFSSQHYNLRINNID